MRKHDSSRLVDGRTLLATLLASDIHRQQQPLIKRFLNRDVIVKAADLSIRGKLKHVDPSKEHSGLGNLILEDTSIVRGSMHAYPFSSLTLLSWCRVILRAT